jgi:hypothetical protein
MWAIAVLSSDLYFNQVDKDLKSLPNIANGLMDGFDPVLKRFVLEAEPDDTRYCRCALRLVLVNGPLLT